LFRGSWRKYKTHTYEYEVVWIYVVLDIGTLFNGYTCVELKWTHKNERGEAESAERYHSC
jgi:hypothetical protein